jgi:ABC-type polar amino acid transport system ATPase subunit
VVKVEGLTKSFADHRLFENLTIEFPSGKLSVIMGPSGCGKSTLLRCINFLELFDSGCISIGNLNVAWKDGESDILPAEKRSLLHKMRLKTGMVFQSFNLFPHLTVLENVTLAPIQVKKTPAREAADLARGILSRVGLSDKVHAYPARLSGGQQQRVAIARSLAMQPEVMLYDEPTSALDPRLVDEVFNVMRELDHEGMTQILVTHHVRFARDVAERVLMFEAGRAAWCASRDLVDA